MSNGIHAQLTINLIVKSVSCPGVYLCRQHGDVSLSVKVFDAKYRTNALKPLFPLNFNTSFTFKKEFKNVRTLFDLHNLLVEEKVFCALLQWPEKAFHGNPRVLATYIGILEDLLFPPIICVESNLDLLMKPEAIFPGIIAPKIEVIKKIEMHGDQLKLSRNHLDSDRDYVDLNSMVEYGNIPENSSYGRNTLFGASDCENLSDNQFKRQRLVCHSPKGPDDDEYLSFRKNSPANSTIKNSEFNRYKQNSHRNMYSPTHNRSKGKQKNQDDSTSITKEDNNCICECDVCSEYSLIFEPGPKSKSNCIAFKIMVNDDIGSDYKISLARKIKRCLNNFFDDSVSKN